MNMSSFKIKYPKFLLLVVTFVLAYIIFSGRNFSPLHDFLLSLGYVGTFLAGILFVYGFTAAPATAVLLITARNQHIILAGFIAGFGALAGDLLIFRFIRHSFADEVELLSKERSLQYINNKIPTRLKKYLILILAGFIISSPLPDEIGVSLLAVSTAISTKVFSVLAYMLNTAGIFVVLVIGNLL